MTSAGHSTARSLSRSECLNEWITHPSGTLGFSHLLMAAVAELALLVEARLYLANRKLFPDAPYRAQEAAHGALPSNGIHLFGLKPPSWMWGNVDMRCIITEIDICCR